jgi:hypothetical protein
VTSQSSLPGGPTASGHPDGTCTDPYHFTMWR